MIEAQERLREEYEHVAIEIPPGLPQIERSTWTGGWVPRGDVLRCQIDDGGPAGEPVIHIDEQELSWEEFGRLLTTFAGWGMRIVIVAEDDTHLETRIEVEVGSPVNRQQGLRHDVLGCNRDRPGPPPQHPGDQSLLVGTLISSALCS